MLPCHVFLCVHINFLPGKTDNSTSEFSTLQFGLGSSDFGQCDALGDVRLNFVPLQKLTETLQVLFESFGILLKALPDVNVLGVGSLLAPNSVYL